MTTLAHAIGYSTLFCVYVLGTLALAPRLWLRHYPPAEREKQPPHTPKERRLLLLHALVFLGVIVLVAPVVSAIVALGRDAAPADVFRHIFTLGVTVSAVDWLIADWLLIRWLQPAWLLPRDTSATSWRDPTQIRKDAAGFVIGSALAAVWAAIAAFTLF